MILVGCLQEYAPNEVYIVRIRDEFDYKWCYFSGKLVGAIGFSDFKNLTLPPVVPNRVLFQDHYTRADAEGDAYERSHAPPLHIAQASESNHKRHIRRMMSDGMVMWLSSGSQSTGRGSLMVYSVFSQTLRFGWHATFLKKAEWRIDKISFLSRALVEGLRESGSRIIAASVDSPLDVR